MELQTGEQANGCEAGYDAATKFISHSGIDGGTTERASDAFTGGMRSPHGHAVGLHMHVLRGVVIGEPLEGLVSHRFNLRPRPCSIKVTGRKAAGEREEE